VNGSKIIIRAAAARDLAEQADYLAERSLEAALRFLDAVAETFRDLASMPEMGSPRQVRNPALAGLRKWRIRGFEDYLIFYRPIGNGIEVLRVLHAARDIDAILEE
jgi:toxin ParE1/3/4